MAAALGEKEVLFLPSAKKVSLVMAMTKSYGKTLMINQLFTSSVVCTLNLTTIRIRRHEFCKGTFGS